MLLSLLHHLATHMPDMLCHLQKIKLSWREDKEGSEWPLHDLRNILLECLGQRERPICMFVDGLDEFEGSMIDLCQCLREISQMKRIKLCLASRPHLLFEQNFRNYPTLILQDVNLTAIKIFLQQSLSNIFLHDKTGTNMKMYYIIDDIAKRAEGVFLWASFAMPRAVEYWLSGKHDEKDLRWRLNQIPSELEDVYHRIFTGLDKAARHDACLILQLVCFAKSPLQLSELMAALEILATRHHEANSGGIAILNMTLSRGECATSRAVS